MIQDTQQGRFWIPEKPEEPVPGIPTINCLGKLELQTSRVENDFHDTFRLYFERDRKPKTIAGVTHNGNVGPIKQFP